MNSNIYLSPHFCLKEFTESTTARKHGIVNEPSPGAVENLRALCQHTLEPLRNALGLPIIVTSGFRAKLLNDLLAHSSSTSQHMQGRAADFYVGKGSREELVRAFHQILVDPNISFDQLILYPHFIHVSYVSPEANRHNILKARSDGKLGYGKLSYANALLLNY